VTDIANGRTDFVHVTPGTSVGLPVTKIVGKQEREIDVLLAKDHVTARGSLPVSRRVEVNFGWRCGDLQDKEALPLKSPSALYLKLIAEPRKEYE